MRRYRSVLVTAITTAVLPVFAAYAADVTPRPQPEAAGQPQQPQAAFAQNDPPAGIPVESHSTGLKFDVGAATTVSRSDELRPILTPPVATPSPLADDVRSGPATSGATAFSRAEDSLYGFSGSAAGGTGLKLFSSSSAPKPGWEVSGRVGPLRFLSPLDSERETKLRLGGRVPGQPRMPGMGLFNVGIHYNFE